MNIIDFCSLRLKCRDKQLLELIAGSISALENLPLRQEYRIAFSGGKDSHALLAVYFLWKEYREFRGEKVQGHFEAVFADTRLESDELYLLLDNIAAMGKIKLTRAIPLYSYWYYQFAYGYPVPNWKNRWCTGRLKIDPMDLQNGRIALTGRHMGESHERDRKLEKSSSCGSTECGIEEIRDSYDPIYLFRNCDIWDFLFYADGTVLYEGVFTTLQETYSSSESASSLRMGCFMCPVIGLKTLQGNGDPEGFAMRQLLEELRNCRRIRNPRTKKLGALYIGDRRRFWEKVDKAMLLQRGFITQEEIDLIERKLQGNSYPKSYSTQWIETEHRLLEGQVMFEQLSIF